MLIRTTQATVPMFLATPEEVETLGAVLLEAVQEWHERPITGAQAWTCLVRKLIGMGAICIIDPYEATPCEHEEHLSSDTRSPSSVLNAVEQACSIPPASEQGWLAFCYPSPTPTRRQ